MTFPELFFRHNWEACFVTDYKAHKHPDTGTGASRKFTNTGKLFQTVAGVVHRGNQGNDGFISVTNTTLYVSK